MSKEQIEALLERAANWPAEAQGELVQSMVDIEVKYSGVYHVDEEERADLAQSGEEMLQGRFASDEEVRALFERDRQA